MYEYRVMKLEFADSSIGTLWQVQKRDISLSFFKSDWKKVATYHSPMLAAKHYDKLVELGGELKETVYLPQ